LNVAVSHSAENAAAPGGEGLAGTKAKETKITLGADGLPPQPGPQGLGCILNKNRTDSTGQRLEAFGLLGDSKGMNQDYR
jgi:hypothetical protein